MQEQFSRLPKRIFLDLSFTLCSGKNSGIERVVRSLLDASQVDDSIPGLPRVQPVYCNDGQFVPVNEEQRQQFKKLAKWEHNAVGQLPKIYQQMAETLCSWTRSRSLQKSLLPTSGHLGIFRLPISFREEQLRRRLARQSKPILPQKEDLFLFPDAYWPRSTFWEAAEKVAYAGATSALVMYDLIPISHPQFIGARQVVAFKRYLENCGKFGSALVAISNTVRDQLREYYQATQPEALNRLTIASFPLGADIQNGDEVKSVDTDTRAELKDIFLPHMSQRNSAAHENSPNQDRKIPPYLMVASFEPRKNHTYLLDAFDRWLPKLPDAGLCLVGRVGWSSEGLIERIHNHPQYGKRLFMFNDLSDREVQFCYEHARGVLFPSMVEGFGLPIVEAINHGCKTIVSDTPIHREVGQSDCTYFSLDDPNSLVQAIQEWEEHVTRFGDAKSENRRENKRALPTWQDSYRAYLSTALRTFQQRA